MSLGASVYLKLNPFTNSGGWGCAEPSVKGEGIYIAENFHMSTQLSYAGIPRILPTRKSAPQY